MRKLGSIGSLSIFARSDGAVMLVSGSNSPELSWMQAETLAHVLLIVANMDTVDRMAEYLQGKRFALAYPEWLPEKEVVEV